METPGGVKGVRVHHLPRAFKSPPSLEEGSSYLYGWLAGYFAADGSMSTSNQPIFTSVSRQNLEMVELVCARLGIATYGIRRKPLKTAWARSEWVYQIQLLTGHLRESFFLIEEHRQRFVRASDRGAMGWTVASVEETGRIEEVFCAVVPRRHLSPWMATSWLGTVHTMSLSISNADS